MAERTELSWPVCEAEQLPPCSGVKLRAGRLCLAHASGQERTAALGDFRQTGVIDARGVEIPEGLFGEILAAAPRGENAEATFTASRFDGAIFAGAARFDGVAFTGDASFQNATFSGPARFDRSAFSGPARFDGATFAGDASFQYATFSGHTRFDDATFSGAAQFGRATFADDVWFFKAAFAGRASFSPARFSGSALFTGSTFSDDAWFNAAVFSDHADFAAATFSARAWFLKSRFAGDVTFRRAVFAGPALFRDAAFSGHAGFFKATFNGEIQFSPVVFRGPGTFAGARFSEARRLGPLLAHRGLNLDNTEFMQAIQIEVSTTGLCCRGARFPGGVQFRLRWARVLLTDADFPAPSILTGIPRLSDPDLAEGEERIARSWRRLLGDEIAGVPQLLSLMRANVAGLGLSEITMADCMFAGAHNLDRMRLESSAIFSPAPAPLGRLSWEGRQVIAEERTWRAARSRPWGWHSPRWPKWLDDRPAALDPAQIAALYRALRKGREDLKDEPGAADFYYGELEMRRRARLAARFTSGNSSRGRAERGLLTVYWLVSGYGLRAWRALAWFAVITALFAAAFHLIGFAQPPRPVSYWTSLLYALRANLSLTDDNVQLTAWGELLQGLLRVTGPVLLGLALLALRGRIKR